MSFELTIPTSETGRNGVYEPRFLDEIADEINTLENKKDTLFCEYLPEVTARKVLLKIISKPLNIIFYTKTSTDLITCFYLALTELDLFRAKLN